PEILFNIPKTLDPRALVTFNSFPSDHATLFYALATGFFIANRKMGVLTFIYVTLLIAIPRLYVGLHYPTDVLAGAILGIGITAFFITRPRVRELIKQWVLVWLDRQPGLFYAAIFIITFQIGTLFIESRELASYIFEFISRTISFFQRNYGWFV
ncbi:MAG: phosphatase PAP2 family protein, partial [Anaerolineales bacterium]|nr:phosphatase PAP2 family protein [Anaerolineales bacterium]